MLIIHKNVRVLNTSKGARSKGMEREAQYHGKKIYTMQKVGNIPYLCKHINQGTAFREYSLGAFSLQIGVAHAVQRCLSVSSSSTDKKHGATLSTCNNLSRGRAKLAERVQHSRRVTSLLPRLICISMAILVF